MAARPAAAAAEEGALSSSREEKTQMFGFCTCVYFVVFVYFIIYSPSSGGVYTPQTRFAAAARRGRDKEESQARDKEEDRETNKNRKTEIETDVERQS